MQRPEQHESVSEARSPQPAQATAADELERSTSHLARAQEWMSVLRRLQTESSPLATVIYADVLDELQASIEEIYASQEMLMQTRQAVEAERERYQELFELAPHGYLVTDMHGMIREANRVASELLGLTPEHLLGKPLAVLIAAESRPGFRNLVQALGDCRDTCEWEGLMRRRPGAVFDAAVTAVTGIDCRHDAGNRSPGRTIRWILRDITERKREEQMLRRQTEALTSTLGALVTERELDTFLSQVLSAIGEQLQATWTALWFYANVQNVWTFGLHRAMRASSEAEVGRMRQLPAHEWRLWHELLQTRKPIDVADLAADKRITAHDGNLFPPTGSLLLIPMLLGDEVIGMMRIYKSIPFRYDTSAIRVAQALAQQATLAVHLTRLAEREQQSLVLAERNRMAREIHDTLAQGFTGIAIQLEAAEDSLSSDVAQAHGHIVRARALARRSLSEARRFVYALRPELLEHHDLAGAIGRIVEEVTAGTGLAVQFEIRGELKPLPADVEDHLLRIAQESLTNVLKHAEAQHVEISVVYGEAELELRIHDDGRGFDVDKTRSGGMGLVGIRERSARIGARFVVDSGRGDGTHISVTTPLN